MNVGCRYMQNSTTTHDLIRPDFGDFLVWLSVLPEGPNAYSTANFSVRYWVESIDTSPEPLGLRGFDLSTV